MSRQASRRWKIIVFGCAVIVSIGWLGWAINQFLQAPSADGVVPGQAKWHGLVNGKLASVEGKWRGKILDMQTTPIKRPDGTEYEWKFKEVSSQEDSWPQQFPATKPGALETDSTGFWFVLPDEGIFYGKTISATIRMEVTWPHSDAILVYTVQDRTQEVVEPITYKVVESKEIVAQSETATSQLMTAIGVSAAMLVISGFIAFRGAL